MGAAGAGFKEQKEPCKRAELRLLFRVSKREGQVLARAGKGHSCVDPERRSLSPPSVLPAAPPAQPGSSPGSLEGRTDRPSLTDCAPPGRHAGASPTPEHGADAAVLECDLPAPEVKASRAEGASGRCPGQETLASHRSQVLTFPGRQLSRCRIMGCPRRLLPRAAQQCCARAWGATRCTHSGARLPREPAGSEGVGNGLLCSRCWLGNGTATAQTAAATTGPRRDTTAPVPQATLAPTAPEHPSTAGGAAAAAGSPPRPATTRPTVTRRRRQDEAQGRGRAVWQPGRDARTYAPGAEPRIPRVSSRQACMAGKGKFALLWRKRSGDGWNCFQKTNQKLQNWMATRQHGQGGTSASAELWFCLPSPERKNLVATAEQLRLEQLHVAWTPSTQTQSNV